MKITVSEKYKRRLLRAQGIEGFLKIEKKKQAIKGRTETLAPSKQIKRHLKIEILNSGCTGESPEGFWKKP